MKKEQFDLPQASKTTPISHQLKLWPFEEKVWGALTYFRKKIIFLEDQLGWFHYQNWIRAVEAPEIKKFLEHHHNVTNRDSTVCFFLLGSVLEEQQVMCTLKSLQQMIHQPKLVFGISGDAQSNLKPWLRNLIENNPNFSLVECQSDDRNIDWISASKEIDGDWVIPVRAGDCFSPRWMRLFRIAEADCPLAEIIYWDEDSVDSKGRRYHPQCKPDWSPELLFSTNYLETAAYKKSLIEHFHRQSIGCGTGIFGLAHVAKQVVHIPFILQHRTAAPIEDQQAAMNQYLAAGKSFLETQGFYEVEGRVVSGDVRWRWTIAFPRVSIIIPTKNNFYYLHRCLSSLLEKTSYPNYEIILMDDHSTQQDVLFYYKNELIKYEHIRIYQNEGPFNYSRVNNCGARLAEGQLFLFLNNDVEILDAHWLEELARWCMFPGVGMVGAKLLYPEGDTQHAGVVIGMTGHAAHLFAGRIPKNRSPFLSENMYRNVSAVTGACMCVRKELFESVGGFDENLALVFNDVEIGLRVLKKGYRIVYTPGARLVHYEGRSRAKYIPTHDIQLGAELLHPDIEMGDKYYNPNLSLTVNWPTLKRKNEPSALSRLEKIVRYKGIGK